MLACCLPAASRETHRAATVMPYRPVHVSLAGAPGLACGLTIKHAFDFGRVARRGIENVRAEMLEKVLAYNLPRERTCLRSNSFCSPSA